jgi:hypothetical protein
MENIKFNKDNNNNNDNKLIIYLLLMCYSTTAVRRRAGTEYKKMLTENVTILQNTIHRQLDKN